MKYTFEEFQKISELEEAILVIENLVDILFEYQGNKEFLIDILVEKTELMKTKFNDFSSCLIKHT